MLELAGIFACFPVLFVHQQVAQGLDALHLSIQFALVHPKATLIHSAEGQRCVMLEGSPSLQSLQPVVSKSQPVR